MQSYDVMYDIDDETNYIKIFPYLTSNEMQLKLI